MDVEFKKEDLLIQIRAKLLKDQIKLWQPPYYEDNIGSVDKEIETLASRYSEELSLSCDTVLCALVDLQNHALHRAKANEEFKETGLASLRLKVPPREDGSKLLNLQITLGVTGDSLIGEVANALGLEKIRIKLIHQGRVIKHETSLESQGIKNGANLLVVVLAGSPNDLRKEGDMYMEMQHVRSDAQLLSESSDDHQHYMQLEDQSGNALNLPASEKKALMVAMTLHERGRTALKLGNHPLALVLLLEADKLFSECNAQILKSVDNYALLNLDIAWCCLCLQSITYIPNAEARLTLCEENFHSSYGPNLERVIALKGTSGNEQALFMRLHLLQAVVMYHQNKRVAAKAMLERAERELKVLKVDDTSMCLLLEMGYRPGEARMNLRAAEGNVDRAVQLIIESRKQKAESRKKAKDEQESRALGKCIDGKQFVSMNFVRMLEDMGYRKNIAILALKNSNNHVSNAIQIILEQPHLLKEEDLPRSLSNMDMQISEDTLEKLVGIGYDPRMAKAALKEASNDLQQAIEMLMTNGGICANLNDLEDDAGGPSCSTSSGASSSSAIAKKIRKEVEQIKKSNEVRSAFERLSEGIDGQEDDYLDLNLQQEEEFLNQYKALLE